MVGLRVSDGRPEIKADCQFLSAGVCEVASALYGAPCPAYQQNCDHCKATATLESPSEASVGLAVHKAMTDGNREKAAELIELQKARGWVKRVDRPTIVNKAGESVELYNLSSSVPCFERGNQTRAHTCEACGQRGVIVPVFSCRKFAGECTIQTTELTNYREQLAGTAPVRSCTLCAADAEHSPPSMNVGAWKRARCSYMPAPQQWAGRYAGGTLFLCGAGPSLKDVDWSVFPWRGAMTMAINLAAVVGPRHDFWFTTDEAGKFPPELWRDRSLIKFTMPGRLSNRLRARQGDRWELLEETPAIMPGVFPVARAGGVFDADTFLTGDTLQLGHLSPAGKLEMKSTFLYALRMAVDLGFKTINLLGTEFKMSRESCYAVDEVKPASGIETSNRTFAFLNQALKALAPRLEAIGVKVWNCTPGSELTAFPRRTYAEAVKEATPTLTESFAGIYAWPPRHQLAVVTCTADRVRAFELLKGYVERQTVKPATWIVADSGRERVDVSGIPYAKRLELPYQDDPWESFRRAMVAGIDAALESGATAVAFFEDDDWYHPKFIERALAAMADGVSLWGDNEARKWNADAGRVSVKQYKAHAATAQTVMSAEVARVFRNQAHTQPHNLDLWIWGQLVSGKRLDTGSKLHASIKGLYPVALTWGHNPNTLNDQWKWDLDGDELKKMIGPEDSRKYLEWWDAKPAG